MLDAVLIFSILTLILGLILGYAAIKFKVKGDPLVEKIEAILPQTQCGQCDFAGCKIYAKALAKGEAEVNQCPPGGQEGADALADLLGVETLPLSAEHGEEKPPMIAVVDENFCIGCTLCIQACPVDAFVGSSKVMTTVITAECTGCDLCAPVCPVDCINMVEVKPTLQSYVPDIKEFNNA